MIMESKQALEAAKARLQNSAEALNNIINSLNEEEGEKIISKDMFNSFVHAFNEFTEAHSYASDLLLTEYEEQEKSELNSIIQHITDNNDIKALIQPEILNLANSHLPNEFDTVVDNVIKIITEKLKQNAQGINYEQIEQLLNENKQAILQEIIALMDCPNLKSNPVINVITIRASRYIWGTTKAENTAFHPSKNINLYNSEMQLNVSKRETKRKEIPVIVWLDFNNLVHQGVTIQDEQRLTPFDRAVYNAVTTLWAAGHPDKNTNNNEYLTPRAIYQILAGNNTKGKSQDMGEAMKRAILQSIDKMRLTEIFIDATAEAEAFGYSKFTYTGSLLPSERTQGIKINGTEVTDCIHFLKSPPLYDYAILKHQIGAVDMKILDIHGISNTPLNIELRDYLLQQIEAMRNPKSSLSSTIKYSTIYEYLKIEAANQNELNKKRKKIRDKAKIILQDWKNKGFIKGYKEVKEGKTYAKITILL